MERETRPGFGIERVFAPFATLLFPPVCPLCHAAIAEPHALCADCWRSLRFIEPPFCEVLGTPLLFDAGPGALSAEAIADPPRFERLRAVVAYDPMAGRLVSALKYSDRTELAPMMATWMARAGAELLADADLVVPVPLHPFRLILRRFNQSAELARHIAKEAGRPHAPELLRRTRWTRRQVGLGAPARRVNVRAAFHVPDEKRAAVAGRRVLLVDDVFTTGATIDAATLALRRGGAATVDVVVFARVAAPL